ncbi:restriction endonuclease subunit S [Vibrio metschnikovii]|uniref:restriction endonuclease subunit S n=1 Tax=Vibrio metschnikovii TaxID=28172 RepID=UPI001C2FD2CC|nr:restriction endonuclease subunit S [Vibrio metschnikovii]
MSELPKGWVGVPLNKIVDKIVGGGTPSKSVPSYYQGNIPWMTVKDMNKLYLTDTVDHITQEAVENSSTNIIPAGTPIIATRMSLGKIVRASFDSAINQDLKALFVNRELNDYYFEYWYRSQGMKIQSLGTGTTVKGVRLEVINALEFPLAPLAEQKRIVAKLDEVLAQVDTIKARLDGIPAILKRFRQSALAAAVSGKLTEEWRVGNFSEAWKALSIGDISTVATGKTPKRTNSEYWNSEDVPWLTSSATGNLFCYEAEQYVSHFAAEDCKLKLFPIGTLLLAMYGEGKTRGQVTELMFEATCNQACAAIMVDESKAIKSYVKLRLLENYEETRKAAAGGNQPNLNLNKVREIAINLPSINEQTEIVRLVDQYFVFADSIEAQVKKAQARVDNLTQSILAKAFRGELVAQDPNDEPADKLLERIAKARTEAEQLAKAAKKAVKSQR